LKTSRPRPKVLTTEHAQMILDACDHLRDRLLFAVLLDCGVRIGEALGLRHEDMEIAEQAVTVTPRPNDNRARAKAGISRTIPASAELMRLYADYLTREYGALDSDYVFVNLWGEPHGRPLAYSAVYDLVLRLRRRTGIDFEPHQYRHILPGTPTRPKRSSATSDPPAKPRRPGCKPSTTAPHASSPRSTQPPPQENRHAADRAATPPERDLGPGRHGPAPTRADPA
jgi:integrase